VGNFVCNFVPFYYATNINPKHYDKHPSMSYSEMYFRVCCWSCGVSYDIYDLIGIFEGIEDWDQKYCFAGKLFPYWKNSEHDEWTLNNQAEIYRLEKIATTDTEYINYCNDRIAQTSYFKERGIRDVILNKFRIGYDPNYKAKVSKEYIKANKEYQEQEKKHSKKQFKKKDEDTFETWDAVIIPSNGGYTVRNTDNSNPERYRKRGRNEFFNSRVLKDNKAVFVVEGEIDALSFAEIGVNAISLGGVTNLNRFVTFVGRNKPSEGMILALDNDKVGEDASLELLRALRRKGIVCKNINVYGDMKDANEALVNNREAFLRSVNTALSLF